MISLLFFGINNKHVILFTLINILLIISKIVVSLLYGLSFSMDKNVFLKNEKVIDLNVVILVILAYIIIGFIIFNAKNLIYKIQREQQKLNDDLHNNMKHIEEIYKKNSEIAHILESSLSTVHNYTRIFNEEMMEQSTSYEEIVSTIEQLTDQLVKESELISQHFIQIQQLIQEEENLKNTLAEVEKSVISFSKLLEETNNKTIQTHKVLYDLNEFIKSLSTTSQKISEINTIMTEIADRTNLLALNASIEAARAGEYGKGFSVVAQEISKLADNSTQNAKSIASFLKEEIRVIDKVSRIIEDLNNYFNEVQKSFENLKNFFNEFNQRHNIHINYTKNLDATISRIAKIGKEIDILSSEQSEGAKSISRAMDNLEKTVLKLSEKSANILNEIQKMKELSEKLKKQ